MFSVGSEVAELLGQEEPRLAEFVLRKLVSGAAAIEAQPAAK